MSFLQLTNAIDGVGKIYVNMSQCSGFLWEDECTCIWNIGDDGPPWRVKESPEEILDMLKGGKK